MRRATRVAALGVGALLAVGLAGGSLDPGREAGPPGGPAAPALAAGRERAEPAGIEIRGALPLSAAATGRALERVLQTSVGAKVRAVLASGALRAPVTIRLNDRGDNLTGYRVPGVEPGETIRFSPWSLPLVETAAGALPATAETILAHELGHAVFKLRDEGAVIREVENPVRAELGLPLRTRF